MSTPQSARTTRLPSTDAGRITRSSSTSQAVERNGMRSSRGTSPTSTITRSRTATSSTRSKLKPTNDVDVRIEPKKQAYRKLEEAIDSKGGTRLNTKDVRSLFDNIINPSFNLLLMRGLQGNHLIADTVLLTAIDHMEDNNIFVPIGLALREGANTNAYINYPKLSPNVHIMGYLYYKVSDKNITNPTVIPTIETMMFASGADVTKPIFDPERNRIVSESILVEESEEKAEYSKLTVKRWVKEQGYSNIIDRLSDGIKNNIKPESLSVIGLLVGRYDLITPGAYSLQSAVKSHIKDWNNLPGSKDLLKDRKYDWKYSTIDYAIEYLSVPAFIYFVSNGHHPRYPVVNTMLIEARKYRDNGMLIAEKSILDMLAYAVRTGTIMDNHQRNILSTLNKNSYSNIMKEYSQPYWRKVCRATGDGNVPERLQRLAISLNIDHYDDTDIVCSRLHAISAVDPDQLKTSAITRNRTKMAADVGNVNEFTSERTPTLVCNNLATFDGNPFDYGDVDISYYRDGNGNIWCYKSDQYEMLINENVNPTTGDRLPIMFIDSIKYKHNIMKKLGLIDNTPKTLSNRYDSLNAADTLGKEHADIKRIIEEFKELMSKNNVAGVVDDWSSSKMERILKISGINVALSSLTTSHAYTTFAWVVIWLQRNDKARLIILITNIKSEAV